MMKRTYFIVLAGICLLGLQCSKDNDNDLPDCPDCNLTCVGEGVQDVFTNTCRANYTCSFEWYENAQLELSASNMVNIIPGNKLVFKTQVHTDGKEYIADDEFTYLLWFEIDPSLDHFSTEDAENARYQKVCFCGDRLPKIPAGCLQGQRIDGKHWKVQANLLISYQPLATSTEAFAVDAVFIKK